MSASSTIAPPARRPPRLTRRALLEAAERLAERDPDLQRILHTHGPPPLWARTPGFETLIRIILEQQVSLASAQAIFQRLRREVVPLTAGQLAKLGIVRLRSLGVTRQKAAYCVQLAQAVRDGRLDLNALGGLDDVTVISVLTAQRGVGPWSASIYLLMALRRPDIWPAGDIALQRAVHRVKRLRRPRPAEQIARIAETWRPFRSVAARMIWQQYLAERRR
jgi:DNA-3-methyladenine glycosylase II